MTKEQQFIDNLDRLFKAQQKLRWEGFFLGVWIGVTVAVFAQAVLFHAY